MADSVVAKTSPFQDEPDMKGWLFKWTNYLKGYQKRWFVLSNGVLSYYRVEHSGGPKLSIRRRRRYPHSTESQAEMSHTCRGTISLHGALIHPTDSCTFVISNAGTQTFHIKASSEVERQSWITALELAKAKAIRAMESEDDEDDVAGGASGESAQRDDIGNSIRELNARLEDLQTCLDLINKHGTTLQRSLSELEQSDDMQQKSKTVNERVKLFRITSIAMINAATEYLSVAQTQGQKWYKMLQHERDQKMRLQEVVEQLARQHSHLEKAACQHSQRPNASNIGGNAGISNTGTVVAASDDEEDNEFFDCVADGGGNMSGSGSGQSGMAGSQSDVNAEDSSFILKIPMTGSGPGHRRNESEGSSSETEEPESKQVLVLTSGTHRQDLKVARSSRVDSEIDGGTFSTLSGSMVTSGGLVKPRRTRVPDKPNKPLNLWSIMKNCIGKDLSKIPMPVNFSEPLSMLQRITEEYDYSELLDIAAKCTDPYEQLAYVAVYSITSYSTTSNRTGKPFNPLLGETFECDRMSDLGWRAFNEQVSHHPPMVAQYCEGREWTCWQEFTMTSKFRGKYLQVIPMGTTHIEFHTSKNRFTWHKATTTVHNIIVGKLWIDFHGDVDLVGYGSAEGLKCHLKLVPYSYFTRDTQRRVKGCVMDAQGQVKYVISGTWDNQLEIAAVTNCSGSPDNTVFQTDSYRVIWQRKKPLDDSDKYYNFTLLACQLNELEDGVAPTDSRLRPDQRLMENGMWDEANAEKERLEEKQRAVRRQRETEAERAANEGRPYPPYEPQWFKKQEDRDTGEVCHVYQGDYWDCKLKQDWSRCPNIY